MIFASRASARSRGVTPFTVACVPTGMKTGVSIVPWAVWRRPARAWVIGHSAWSSKNMRRMGESGHYYYGPRMNGNEREYLEQVVTAAIGAAYEVSNQLGCGFLEKVYERALVRELVLRGFKARTQVKTPVWYKGYPVGEYVVDLLVDDRLV